MIYFFQKSRDTQPPPRKHRAWGRLYVCILVALLSAFSASALPPGSFQFPPPVVSIHNDDLLLNLSLTVNNEDGLRDMLKDGAVLQLDISLRLTRTRYWWLNADIESRTYSSVISHDLLSRDFVVRVPTPTGEKILRDKNLTRLLHASWRQLSLPVTSIRALSGKNSDEEFTISLTLALQHTEVPPWLEKSFIFWSSDVVPQKKYDLPLRLPLPPTQGNER